MSPIRFRKGIAARLYFIGGLALITVVLLAGASIYFACAAGLAAHNVLGPSIAAALEATELELLLEKHRRLIEGGRWDYGEQQFRVDVRAVDDVATRLHVLAGKPGDPLATRIANQLPQLLRLGESVLGQAGRDSAGMPSLIQSYAQEADAIQSEIRAYRAERMDAAAAGTRSFERTGWQLVSIQTSLAIIAMLLIGPVSLVLVRDTALRVRNITDAIVRLARHDTTARVAANCVRDDEIGMIARAVEVFRANAVALLEKKTRLEQVNLWLDIAFNNMARGLSMYDANQRLVVCNANYARLYELPNELIRPGTPFEQVIEYRKALVAYVGGDPLDPLRLNAAERVKAIARISEDTKSSLTMKNGKVIEVTTRPLKEGGWVALHEDVTERRKAADRIVHLARHDAMTGLANRHHFRDVLEAALGALGQGEQLALHCIDLDRFKQVNDTLGHPVGDLLLQLVAKRLQEAVRSGDVVARLGGDEFAVLQRSVSAGDDAAVLAGRLISVVSAPCQIQGHKIGIGATIGISLVSEAAADPDSLMKNADMALYRGKTAGKGQYVFFEPEMEGQLRARVKLEADLQQAVALQQFELFYQPIINLERGAVTGCEALIRWRHPDRGMVSPAEFIPVAEDIGLIATIGAFAVQTACQAAVGWPEQVSVAVNLSAAQFGTCDLVEIVSSALQSSGLVPERLVLEVTESVILDDNPETVEVLHDLRGLGVRIALDDFGTGYSSLSYLKSFPFDKIKIDQSFVKDLSKRSDCVAIVGAIAHLARSLSMTTVAEGVETEDHLARVRAAGCTDAQGYLFSRPVPAGDVLGAIEACNRKLEALSAAA